MNVLDQIKAGLYERPPLTEWMSSTTIREYYYSKEELVDFCRSVGVAVSGSKREIIERIICFLDTGEKIAPKRKIVYSNVVENLTPEDLIEENIICSQKHRAFFRQHIGGAFSFNVPFQKWLKSHAGSTYAEAIEAWYALKSDKQSRFIERQFECNQYVRDFFAANSSMTLRDAIRCWKYKKKLPGPHRYEEADLIVLSSDTGI